MANSRNNINVRKTITTYGKTRRKIINGSVFNTDTQEATTNIVNQNAVKDGLRGKDVSVDITSSNSRKSENSLAKPIDIYDFPSDDETQIKEATPRCGQESFQHVEPNELLQGNNNQRRSNIAINNVRSNSVPHEDAKSRLKAKSKNLPELTDNISNINQFNKKISVRRSPKLVRSISDSHSYLEIHEKKYKAKQFTATGPSDAPKSDKDNLKRKYTAVTSKTQLCKMSPELSSLSLITSKMTRLKENDTFDMPVNDDQTISVRSLPRRIAKTSNFNQRRNRSPVAAKVEEKKKIVEPSLLNDKGTKESLYISRELSSPTKKGHSLEIKYGNTASMSLEAQKVKKSRKQKQPKSASEITSEKAKPYLSLPANDLDMISIQPKISPERHSIWQDLLDIASDADQELSEISDSASHSYLESSTFRHDNSQLEPKNEATPPSENMHRLRMIDSLVQKAENLNPSDNVLSDELESDKESHTLSIKSSVSPSRSRSQSNNFEPLGSQVMPQESQSSISSLGVGPKFTYSQQRSMLAEEDLVKDLAFSLLATGQDHVGKRSRRGSVPKLKPLSSFHDEEEEDESQVLIKSVYELRKSGAIKRFVDECTDLFDRIGYPGKVNSIRRSGLLDLASKMRDTNFAQQFRANSMEQQLFLKLNEEKDAISGFLIMSILIALVMEGPVVHLIPFLCLNGFKKLIFNLLDFKLGIPKICKDRKTNMSKLAQSLLVEYHNQLLRSPSLDGKDLDMISPRTIALICLKKLFYQSRDVENSSSLISEELVEKLFTIMKLILSESLQKSSNDEISIDLPLVAECLQLYYTAASNFLDKNKWLNNYLPLLADVLELTLHHDLCDAHTEILKLTLQVTNQNSLAVEKFVQPSLILTLSKRFVSQFNFLNGSHSESQFSRILDHLSLLLGVLINFSESSPRVGEYLQAFKHTNDEDPLKDMIIIFQVHSENISQAESEQEVLRNVVLGYLSVTLGFLFLYPPIGNRLRDEKTKLLDCIEEFILIHKLADKKLIDEASNSQITAGLGEEEVQIEAHKELTERLERLVVMLKFENR
ncbi:putative rheb small monomeric gtpase protein [Erysiphe necator]|uniref:Putative rheb small monomeric gtpase protein n=1 Tax=Uncinula necator TaxID=52586 RepID=A0A0B1PAK3_UNCNE|nr:putative rheb small monomeric gtpase protein [Erysiphe necator]